ncbi:hypothetical protein N7536_004464 [Penicillium majusculum]|uniref:Zn(2)-C6 fungal-type domain-containing protein n=1 Tax=Penicillium solitum TaxID=60172 RepID=A0A1V6R7J2_9EURO|nr:uncharacterized protein PENSOL_c012G04449 [Penicillium solitum]KAJ5694052.1 hypothetical protein N7536_004464 [Penicillium majusculum]OQD97470.1 hypothetical protein PENSOL_c012G04449 [Penicillium solitum]
MTSVEKSQLSARRRKWAPKLKSGCMTCKIRRVKCDEEKPQCRRCISTGRKCDGYPHPPFAVKVFHDSDSCRKRLVNSDLVRPGSSSPLFGGYPLDEITIPYTHISEQTDEVRLWSGQTSPLIYPLAESWNTHFMPFVINKFKLAFEMSKSIFNAIPDVLSKAEEKSALYQACNAVARAYMATITRTSKATSDRAKAYGSALMATRSAIQDPQRCKSDNTLLAVWLLGLYELLLGIRKGTEPVATPGWQFHNQVLSKLIRLRGSEQFTTRSGRNLFVIIFTNVETQAFMSGQECEEALTWFLEYHKYCELSEYPILRACIFSHHCARICSHVRALVDTGDLDKVLSSSPSILQEMDEVEQITHPLSHDETVASCVVDHPTTPYTRPKHTYPCYVGVHVIQCNFRMRLSYAVLEFLGYACKAPGCTPQQRMVFNRYQRRCVEELEALVDKASRILDMFPDVGSDELLDRRKGVVDELDGNNSGTEVSPDTVHVPFEEPRERSTPAVKLCFDLQQPIDGKSTLLFNHNDRGISVLRFWFGNETETHQRQS